MTSLPNVAYQGCLLHLSVCIAHEGYAYNCHNRTFHRRCLTSACITPCKPMVCLIQVCNAHVGHDEAQLVDEVHTSGILCEETDRKAEHDPSTVVDLIVWRPPKLLGLVHRFLQFAVCKKLVHLLCSLPLVLNGNHFGRGRNGWLHRRCITEKLLRCFWSG